MRRRCSTCCRRRRLNGEGERLLRALRDDAVVAPLALSALAHRELLSPADRTDAEHLRVLAESLLQLVEPAGGREGTKEAPRAPGAPRSGTRLPPRWNPRTRTGPDSKSSGNCRPGPCVLPPRSAGRSGRKRHR
ncbi:hypothetical protein AB0I27_06160 [Streptomyces sp. NPDC050597]|uniref:hypothetical protein n=1 Tax=Streptomyces sp. NPDC050597 TaxID=3157212 RepID=UPI00344A4FA0